MAEFEYFKRIDRFTQYEITRKVNHTRGVLFNVEHTIEKLFG